MVNPSTVISPRSRLEPGTLRILYTSANKHWSMAEFGWSDIDDPGNYEMAIGLRWNGDVNDPNDLGNPRSHSHPTWFILPDVIASLAKAFVEAIREERRI